MSDISDRQLLVQVHGKVEKLVGVIQGVNGVGGMARMVEKHEERIGELEDERVVTEPTCMANQKTCQALIGKQIVTAVKQGITEKGRSRWLVVKDIIMIVLGSGGIGGVLILMLQQATKP